MIKNNKKMNILHFPQLDSILMVEDAIQKSKDYPTRMELWKNLPKQVMWQTFLVILDYLDSINKIAFDKDGKIAYIWNPTLAKRLSKRKEITI